MSHLEELYRQFWLRPDDDELLLVLGDALLAAGDPRGELIQMQLHPEIDHARRAMRLLQQYGLTLLGQLRGAVIPLAYERGFLASCQVIDPTGALDRDEWSTVHTIELAADEEDFAVRPVMRSLRRLRGVTPAVLLRLADEVPARLAALSLEAPFHPDLPAALDRRRLHDLALAITVTGAAPEDADQLEAVARRWPRLQMTIVPA